MKRAFYLFMLIAPCWAQVPAVHSGTAVYPSSGTIMIGGNNLSEITAAATARTNLGLGSAATISSTCSGTDISGTLPGCTVQAIGGKTVSLANTFTTSGNFALTLTSTNTTNATLPAGTTTLLANSRAVNTSAPLGGGGALSSDLTLTCTTCATTTNGGALSATSPVTISAAGVIACATCSTTAGTVTSVGQSFTGGLISVGGSPITTNGTLALTVAGTSGGIPYFSGAATWAASAAGVQNAMMAWGGAGNAPTSPLSLLVTNQNSATETWTLFNSTASTGVTQLVIKEGAGQSSTGGLVFQTSGGTAWFSSEGFGSQIMQLRGGGGLFIGGSSIGSATNGAIYLNEGSKTVELNNTGTFSVSSTGNANGTADISMDRDAAGILGVTNGTQGTTAANYRAIKASAHYVAGTTFTASGCTPTSLVGGATAGHMTIATGVCGGVTVTMGNSATAPTQWSCVVADITTPANLWQQSAAGTSTTAVFSGTSATNDVIKFHCIGY